jgi:hypothetical protein
MSVEAWQRRLDNHELLSKCLGDLFKPLNKEHCAMNIIARVSFDKALHDNQEKIAALRRAWIWTRYHHPLIAVLLFRKTHIYLSPDRSKLEAWASETFCVHDKSVAEFLGEATWNKYSSLHFFPSESKIVMRTHHWVIDGIGALHLLDRFLTYLSADDPIPSFGCEHARLPPSYRMVAGLPDIYAPSSDAKAQDAFDQYQANMPSVGLPILPASVPGSTKVIKLACAPPTLSSLLAATRKENIGLTAAVQSAIILATREFAPTAVAKKNFSALAFFNHRQHLKPPYNDIAAWPMGVYMLGLPFSQPDTDFANTARAMENVYGQVMALDKCEAVEWYDLFCARMIKFLQSSLLPEVARRPTPPQLSSIGLVDGRVKAWYKGKHVVVVESVEPVLDNMSAQLIVFQWSFGGTWYLNACYNESYYAETDVVIFLERVTEILFKEMELKTKD